MKLFIQKTVIFLLIPSLTVFLIELTARAIGVHKISHHNIFAKSQNLVPLIDENAIVFLGDSRVEWGIKPLLIQKQLPKKLQYLKVINLALPGSNGLDILRYLKQNKVYPKVIIIGYTRNVGRYQNFELDRIKYSLSNQIRENVEYYIKQRLIISDDSIQKYIEKEDLYFKSHKYDKRGGVVVIEYGNYSERKKVQLKYYKLWNREFNPSQLSEYAKQLIRLIEHFKKKNVTIFGLYMPVSNRLYKLEQHDQIKQTINFDKFFDFHSLYSNKRNERKFFYDGSHLSHEYSSIFSEILGETLIRELQLFGIEGIVDADRN